MAILYNKSNVQVGIANLFIDLDVDTTPATLPADSVPFGQAWAGNWVHSGATTEGVKFSVEPDVKNITIEESPTPALILPDSVDVSVESELAEDTLESMQIAYGAGGTITTTAAGVGQIGKKELSFSLAIGNIGVGLDMSLRNGHWRRILLPICNSTGNTETSYRRSENARTYPVEFHLIDDVENVVIREKTADATS